MKGDLRRILRSGANFVAVSSTKRSVCITQSSGISSITPISGPSCFNSAAANREVLQTIIPPFVQPGFAYRAYATNSIEEASSNSSNLARSVAFVSLLVGSGLATYYFYPRLPKAPVVETPEEGHTISNWSNTHEVKTKVYVQPESLDELERVVQIAHEHKQKIRAVGSGLSPNGIGLCAEGMVNLALMDNVLKVDEENGRVTVQAGARVEQVVEALKPYGLTLQNFASIKEQQIGGFIQVGAHGTGAKLPTVDETVVSLKLVTPAKGTLDLTAESDPELFYLARCGLGSLGVVAEVTLQCVPRSRLLEYTFVTNMKGVKKNHRKWVNQMKHLRYMWIPDTDTVVVVQCNPLPEGKDAPKIKTVSADEKLRDVRALYRDVAAGEDTKLLTDEQLSELSFTELRDVLIAIDPLNREHIIRVNKAEAEFWKRNEGYRIGWSDEILGFDCGGQQWVSEIGFPVGTLNKPDMKDIKYIEEILKLIKDKDIPAPAPIEQRWSASSQSPLSLASSSSPYTLYSWVGIIMYLPTEEAEQRAAITKSFMDYRKDTHLSLGDQYNAMEHWAKIEVPTDEESLHLVQERLRKRFPVKKFNRWRSELDPHGILSNNHIDKLFPM